MTPSRACIDLVKASEGLELGAYPDPKTGGAPWTIGYGTTGPDIVPGLVWTKAQAEARFAADLAAFARGVATALGGAATTQGQFDALVSFAYNVGLKKATGSTLWRMHRAGNHAGAAGQFGLWINKGSNVERGLRIRRAKEAALYRGQP